VAARKIWRHQHGVAKIGGRQRQRYRGESVAAWSKLGESDEALGGGGEKAASMAKQRQRRLESAKMAAAKMKKCGDGSIWLSRIRRGENGRR
jgi:hypothetical protein